VFQNTDPLVLLIIVVAVVGLGFFAGNQLDLNRTERRRRKRELLPKQGVEPEDSSDVDSPDAQHCDLEHMTAEQRQLLGWAGGQARHDIERTKEYVKASVTLDLLGIYSLSDPIVTVHFDVSSSAMHRVIVGDEVKGHIKSYQILGDAPKNQLDGNGSKEVLSLLRGGNGRLTLEQHISTDLRNNWIRNHLEKEIPFYLKNLFVSVQLANPYVAGVVHQDNLEYQANVSAALPRIMDWDGSELKKIVDAS